MVLSNVNKTEVIIMVVKVNYKIRRQLSVPSINTDLYPIKTDSQCLEIEPLEQLCNDIQDFIKVLKRTNVIINEYQGICLGEIVRAIVDELKYGEDELDAIINVSSKYNLPLHVVFLAYSTTENYRFAYEKFIISNVIKILNELGFKPMQIYRKIRELPEVGHSYRDVLEVLKAWHDNDFRKFAFFKLDLKSNI